MGGPVFRTHGACGPTGDLRPLLRARDTGARSAAAPWPKKIVSLQLCGTRKRVILSEAFFPDDAKSASRWSILGGICFFLFRRTTPPPVILRTVAAERRTKRVVCVPTLCVGVGRRRARMPQTPVSPLGFFAFGLLWRVRLAMARRAVPQHLRSWLWQTLKWPAYLCIESEGP
jgi:hypothetical protein